MKPFTSLESTTVKRSYGILTLVTPLGMGGALEGKIVSMVYLVVIIIELSYETSHSAYNSTIDGRAMLYRTEIDHDGAQISPLGHFSAGWPPSPPSAGT